jgi:hypothetical protein
MKIHVALLSALLAAPSLAQNTGRADTFVLAAGEVSINDLIDRCAAFLDYNILVSPQELAACVGSGGVKLQKAVETDRDGCEELLANLLYRNGLVLTVLDEKLGMLEIIHASGPRGREIQTRALMRTPAQVLARPRLKVPVMTTVPLEFINATIATNALRPFFASTGGAGPASSLTLGNVGNSRALLLSGMQDQVAHAVNLIRACDVETVANDGTAGRTIQDQVRSLEQRVAAIEEKLAALGTIK